MEVVDFVVHFGAGNVRVMETGVDLREYNNMVMQLPDPERARIAAVQEYLLVILGMILIFSRLRFSQYGPNPVQIFFGSCYRWIEQVSGQLG